MLVKLIIEFFLIYTSLFYSKFVIWAKNLLLQNISANYELCFAISEIANIEFNFKVSSGSFKQFKIFY